MATMDDSFYRFSISDADEQASEVEFKHTMVVAPTDAVVDKTPLSSAVPVYGPVAHTCNAVDTVKEDGAYSVLILNSMLKTLKKQNVSVQFGSFTVDGTLNRDVNPLMLEVILGEMDGWLRFMLGSVEESFNKLAP